VTRGSRGPSGTSRRQASCLAERGLQTDQIGRAEHEAVSCRHVDQIEVDAGVRHAPRQIGEDARPILDVDDDDLALAAHAEMGDRQRSPRGFGVRNEDVQLDLVAVSDARRRRQVDAGIADRRRDPRQGPRLVLDLDNQVERNRAPPTPSAPGTLSHQPPSVPAPHGCRYR